MDYKYTQAHESYEMYAAGGVFYSAPGLTAFPVRLAVEIFRRCQAIRAAQGAHGPTVVYDPCCGGAYHLATMAYFNWDQIAGIYASDIDEDALGVAARNLSLLTLDGMDRRIAELTGLYEQYGKNSHKTFLEHAEHLRQQLAEAVRHHPLSTQLFRADATDAAAIAAALPTIKIDVVLTDIPYGRLAAWGGGSLALAQGSDPVHELLESLLPVLSSTSVLAVAAAKKEKIAHDCYTRLARLQVGARQIVILQPT
jgi:23S rRNA (guanine2535-N1)-methyltransferase